MNGPYTITPDAAAASERCTFDLRYERSERPRRFTPGEISGEPITNAWGPDADGDGEVSGDWDNGGDVPPYDVSMKQWIEHYFEMAVTESVHEALEWFQVDGMSFIDPHGSLDLEIYRLTAEFTKKLVQLRKQAQKRLKEHA